MSDLLKKLKSVDALLPTEVYSELYKIVVKTKPNIILEVGTAHGGATIAMALGAQSNNKNCKIFTIDTFESLDDIPSSRAKFGSKIANTEIVERNFANAGVSDLIELFVGRSEEFPSEKKLSKIDVLMLDADGRIDRDLILYKDYLRDDTVIIIDDISGGPKLSHSLGNFSIDLKHVAVESLLKQLTTNQIIHVDYVVKNTAICRPIRPDEWTCEMLMHHAIVAYRNLVFTKISKKLFLKRFVLVSIKNNRVMKMLLPIFKLPFNVIKYVKNF